MVAIKKIILLALTALMMVGCYDETTNSVPIGKGLRDAHLYNIDSCEYIVWAGGTTHKGNCRFCAERDSIKWEKRKKELEELVEQLKDK